MQEYSQIVRIDRHRLGDNFVFLTYQRGTRYTRKNPRKTVFVQHGLGSRKERHLELCLRLADAGYIACSLDARHHGDRSSQDMRRSLSDMQGTEFPAAFIDTVRGTVEDIITVANTLGISSYGIIGHSMGGLIALKTAQADKRVSALVCISGAIEFSPVKEKNAPLDLTPQVREAIKSMDPAANVSDYFPCPILLLHGDADELVPISGAERLYSSLESIYESRPDSLKLVEYPGVGHDFIPQMAEDSLRWIRQFFICTSRKLS